MRRPRNAWAAGLLGGVVLSIAAPHYASVGQYYAQHRLQMQAIGAPDITTQPSGCTLGPAVLRAFDASQPPHFLVGVTTIQLRSPSGMYVSPWMPLEGNGGHVAVAFSFSTACAPVSVDVVGVFVDGHTASQTLNYRHRL